MSETVKDKNGGLKIFRIKIEGITPLMHHRMSEEAVMGLLGAKSKKKQVKVERTPREIAEEAAYKSKDGKFFIPSGYISGAFGYAAGDFKQTSSSRKSYKAIAGGIFRPLQEEIFLTNKKGKVLDNFEVDIKKATNHLKGAIAVCRPRFDEWACEFDVQIDTDLIAVETAQQILEDAGRKAGIGSFRVAKSGYFGQFRVCEFTKL